MLTRQEIIDFCNQHNYDIRVSGNMPLSGESSLCVIKGRNVNGY